MDRLLSVIGLGVKSRATAGKGERGCHSPCPSLQPPGSFAARNNEKPEHYIGAWSAYYKTPVEAGALVGDDHGKGRDQDGRKNDGKRRVQDGSYAETKEKRGGFGIPEAPSLDRALDWAARCRTGSTQGTGDCPALSEI